MRQVDLENVRSVGIGTVRDINCRILLNLIRTRQPVSRADLARLSGLRRSTVSLIVEQLIAEGWVREGPTGRLSRGRRPTYLQLSDRRAVLGVDIRPLRTTVALSDVNARFTSLESFPTPQDASGGIAATVARLRRLIEGQPDLEWEGIGVSLPGRVDPSTRKLIFAPNLPWGCTDLKAPLEEAFGLPVELENAANACVLAEVWFGGSASLSDLAVVTVSEGIGTGVFANGQLVCGAGGMAGEFGHVMLDPGGPPCACGKRGCWEVFASNRACVRYYLERSGNGAGPSYHDLLALAEQGDARAVRALETQALYLARGASLIAVGLEPASIVFVGEVARAWDRLGPIVEKEIAAQSLSPRRIRITAAADGAQARLRGTIALVLQRHFGLPSSLCLTIRGVSP